MPYAQSCIIYNALFSLIEGKLTPEEKEKKANEKIDALIANKFNNEKLEKKCAFDDARVCSELFKILVKMPAKKKARRKKQAEPSATAANLATLALQ